MQKSTKVPFAFWFWVYAIAWLITVPIALEVQGLANFGGIPRPLGFLIGIVPALVALVLVWRAGELGAFLRRAFSLRAPAWTYVAAIAIPLAALVAVSVGSRWVGRPVAIDWTPQAAAFFFVWLAFAFGEELGWRAYAFPRMVARHGFWRAATALGLIWCIWHYPKNYTSPYAIGFWDSLPSILAFSLQIIVGNYLVCWLYVRGGGTAVIPSLMHAAFNLLATFYLFAPMDWRVTAAMAIFVLAIRLFDRTLERAAETLS